jgi:glycosyltransferase involved in cell wall biosynthesis
MEKRFSDLEGNFKIMFAGNIGEAQDIDTILNAAVLLKDRKNITWLFVGDGRFRVHLEEAINSRGLSETVYLLGRHPIEAMPYFFSKADVMLASLKPDPVFALTVPAKIQTYMASKKPILSMVSGEGNTIVQQAACGLTCESGDYVQLAHNASLMAQYSSQELSDMGENGFAFYSQNFQKDKLIDRLENFLSSELD